MSLLKEYPIRPSGDGGLIIKLGNEIDEDINREVVTMLNSIRLAGIKGILELIPTYADLLVLYDPVVLTYSELVEKLRSIQVPHSEKSQAKEVISIPVCYGGHFGEDLEEVARINNLSPEEVIRLHSGRDYLIYMLGFTPGFPYLGGMSEKIAAPRLEVPKERILAGSVGIAGKQTGIYPLESPGGWRIIGRTPLVLFDPLREPAILLKAGQYIRFVPISEEEYIKLSSIYSA